MTSLFVPFLSGATCAGRWAVFVSALLMSLASLAARADMANPAAEPATKFQVKTLRFALATPETGFDPAQVIDVNSRQVVAAIFESPLGYDPNAAVKTFTCITAARLPTFSADFRELTVQLRPGIRFQDDPAFEGRPRELTAADYVYSLKRFFDPRLKSPSAYVLEGAGVLGLPELRAQALKTGRLDYDTAVPGLEAVDRYTLRLRFAKPNPHFIDELASPSVFVAVAREVVEAAGDDVMARPVGTGPFRLAQWVRGSRITLERVPGYTVPTPLTAATCPGRIAPKVDGIEISIIEEAQPRWLAFLQGRQDVLLSVPNEFAPLAFPNNRLAPHLAQRGMQLYQAKALAVSVTYFNMEDPLVGGYGADKVALRRAISLAYDVSKEINLVRHQQAVAANSLFGPGSFSYSPEFHTEPRSFDVARAKALLDLYGYVDRDADGWRETPEGKPLTLVRASMPDQMSRQMNELWKRQMDAVGLRMEMAPAGISQLLAAGRAGKLMMWTLTYSAASGDGDLFASMAYGPGKGQLNLARFDLPAYNDLYERQRQLPNGPERDEVFLQAKKLLAAYLPYKAHVHPINSDLVQPWVSGYVKNTYASDFWRHVDVHPHGSSQ